MAVHFQSHNHACPFSEIPIMPVHFQRVTNHASPLIESYQSCQSIVRNIQIMPDHFQIVTNRASLFLDLPIMQVH